MGRRQNNQTTAPKGLLTRAEIRRYLRVNERTIDSWLTKGRLIALPGPPRVPTPVTSQSGLYCVWDPELNERLRIRGRGRNTVSLDLPSIEAATPEVPGTSRRRPIRRRQDPRQLSRDPATPTGTARPVTRAEVQGSEPTRRHECRDARIERQETRQQGRLGPPAPPRGVHQGSSPIDSSTDEMSAALVEMQFPTTSSKRAQNSSSNTAEDVDCQPLEENQVDRVEDAPPSANDGATGAEGHDGEPAESDLDEILILDAELEGLFASELQMDLEARAETAATSTLELEPTNLEAATPEGPESVGPTMHAIPAAALATVSATGAGDTWFAPPTAPDLSPMEGYWLQHGEEPVETTVGFDSIDPDIGPAFEPVDPAPAASVTPDPASVSRSGSQPDDETAAAQPGAGTATSLADSLADSLAARLEKKLDDLAAQLEPLADLAGPELGRSIGSGLVDRDQVETAAGGDLEAKLEGILASLSTLQGNGGLGQEIEDHLQELKANFEIAQGKRDILAGSLGMLSDDVKELRLQLGVTTKAALASAKTVQNFTERLARQQPAATLPPPVAAPQAPPRPTAASTVPPGLTPTTVVLGIGVLLLSWSLMFYLKTGNVNLALLGLVVVNLAGCATILMSRSIED